ncbi:UNVERIFIED_CONTAM: hypothetical protein K2H54_038668 [Gekko kuhli]
MMAPVSFFLLAVLLAIANRGSSIKCQTCYSFDGNCTNPIVACSPEFDSCSSLVVEIKTSAKTLKVISKDCTTHDLCTPGAIFMDLETGYQETGNSICCTTDGCNTASLTVPTKNETLNGLRCPFCFAESYEACKREVIDCSGWETQCFTRGAGGVSGSPICTPGPPPNIPNGALKKGSGSVPTRKVGEEAQNAWEAGQEIGRLKKSDLGNQLNRRR